MGRKELVEIIIDKIRASFQEKDPSDMPFNKDLDKWNIACVAMDTIEDTLLAIQDYEVSEENNSFGSRYLQLYGLLQAVFLQQDAIKYLLNVLGGNFDREKDSLVAWNELRDLRNLTVGHPIDNGGKKRCYIVRVSLAKHGFECIVWNKNDKKDEFIKIDIMGLLDKYKKEASRILKEIYNFL
jgi:hypothetical protein